MSPNAPSFTHRSRLLLLAPHPDDESLATGVLLQRATRAGASVRVVYITDGENNPWPQRVLERKWHLTADDRARWGQLRRREALNALAVLGVNRLDVAFLELPDQGLTDLLLGGCQQTLDRLGKMIADWRPTDILAPDISDTHPDHSALALMLRFALEDLSPAERPASSWSFLVHGKREAFTQCAIGLEPAPPETAFKMAAIGCHNTQLKLSCARFMAYAARPEHVRPLDLQNSRHAPGYLSNGWRDSGNFVITVPRLPRKLFSPRPNLFLLGRDPNGKPRCMRIPIKGSAETGSLYDCATGARVGRVQFEGDLFSGLNIAIPRDLFSFDSALYVKLDRGRIFFDEAGWLQVEAEAATALEPVNEVDSELLLAPG